MTEVRVNLLTALLKSVCVAFYSLSTNVMDQSFDYDSAQRAETTTFDFRMPLQQDCEKCQASKRVEQGLPVNEEAICIPDDLSGEEERLFGEESEAYNEDVQDEHMSEVYTLFGSACLTLSNVA